MRNLKIEGITISCLMNRLSIDPDYYLITNVSWNRISTGRGMLVSTLPSYRTYSITLAHKIYSSTINISIDDVDGSIMEEINNKIEENEFKIPKFEITKEFAKKQIKDIQEYMLDISSRYAVGLIDYDRSITLLNSANEMKEYWKDKLIELL